MILKILQVSPCSPKLNGRCRYSLVYPPYCVDKVSRWLVLPISFFSGQFLCFVICFFSFPIVFRLCLFSFLILLWFLLFLCSLWFLKFSLDALADSLPQLFSNCFQFFFFLWKEHWPGDADSSSRSVFTAHMRRWQSSFFSGFLPVDGLCGLHGFLGLLQHQMPCGILTWGRSAGWRRK